MPQPQPTTVRGYSETHAGEDDRLALFIETFITPHASRGVAVELMHEDLAAQEDGYDMRLRIGTRTTGTTDVFVEFKCDEHPTCNIVWETISLLPFPQSPRREVVPGWGVTSRAGWLAYQYKDTQETLFLPLPATRQYAYRQALTRKVYATFNPTLGTYYSMGELIDLNDLLENVPGAMLVLPPTATESKRLREGLAPTTMSRAIAVMKRNPEGCDLANLLAGQAQIHNLPEPLKGWVAGDGRATPKRLSLDPAVQPYIFGYAEALATKLRSGALKDGVLPAVAALSEKAAQRAA